MEDSAYRQFDIAQLKQAVNKYTCEEGFLKKIAVGFQWGLNAFQSPFKIENWIPWVKLTFWIERKIKEMGVLDGNLTKLMR